MNCVRNKVKIGGGSESRADGSATSKGERRAMGREPCAAEAVVRSDSAGAAKNRANQECD